MHNSQEWFEKNRARAKDIYKNQKPPQLGSESWKYTQLKEFLNTNFIDIDCTNADYFVPQEILTLFSEADHSLIFYNGKYLSSYSKPSVLSELNIQSLPAGLETTTHFRERAKLLLERPPAESLASIGWQQRVNTNQGVLVNVTAQESVGEIKKIAIVYVYGNISNGSDEKPFVVYPRNIYGFDKNSKVEIVEAHFAANDIEFQINTATDLICESESNVSYSQIFWPGSKAYIFNDVSVQMLDSSELKYFNLNIDSQLTRNEQKVFLTEKNARLKFYSLSILTEKNQIDNNSFIHHQVGDTFSEQVSKSVIGSESKAIFSGRLLIDKDAQNADAAQKNSNLFLSTTSEAYTKPQLEVYADNVKAAHGATVGQLNEDEIFYLQSRGIDRSDAIKMLAIGFQQELIEKIESQFIKNILLHCVEFKQGAL